MRARVLKITRPAAPWYHSRFWNPRKWVVAVVRSYASTPLRGALATVAFYMYIVYNVCIPVYTEHGLTHSV